RTCQRRTRSSSAGACASISIRTKCSSKDSRSVCRFANSSCSSSSCGTRTGCTIACSSSTWCGAPSCTSSRAPSTSTCGASASASSGMTQTPSSSSRSAVSGTSGIPTRSGRRLVVQFLLPTLAALGGVLVTAIPYLAVTLAQHQIGTLAERLEAEARVAGEALPWEHGAAVDAGCARLAADLGTRLTLIAPDGHVLGESTRPSESLENHANRPEIRDALAHGSGRSVRHSATV